MYFIYDRILNQQPKNRVVADGELIFRQVLISNFLNKLNNNEKQK